MNARRRALLGVLIMSAVLIFYYGLILARVVALFQTGTPLTITIGLALLVLPLVGFWALFREIAFGHASTRLVDQLEESGLIPEEEIDTLPSGKPIREQADALFPKYQEEVEADETSWQAWMRLGIMYDACGDRKRAREAIRRAISLEKVSGNPLNNDR